MTNFGRKQKILIATAVVPFSVATVALFTDKSTFDGWLSATQYIIGAVVLGGLLVPMVPQAVARAKGE